MIINIQFRFLWLYKLPLLFSFVWNVSFFYQRFNNTIHIKGDIKESKQTTQKKYIRPFSLLLPQFYYSMKVFISFLARIKPNVMIFISIPEITKLKIWNNNWSDRICVPCQIALKNKKSAASQSCTEYDTKLLVI